MTDARIVFAVGFFLLGLGWFTANTAVDLGVSDTPEIEPDPAEKQASINILGVNIAEIPLLGNVADLFQIFNPSNLATEYSFFDDVLVGAIILTGIYLGIKLLPVTGS